MNMPDFINHLNIHREILQTAVLIPSIILLRWLWLRWHYYRNPDLELEFKRRAMVVSRNLALLVAVIALTAVWATQIQHFALSMVALAAATVLATKELIMCLLGSMMRMITNQYSIGDYVEIANIRGRVVDINMFNTLVIQTGTNTQLGDLSGKTVSFPNSLLLSAPLSRDNVMGNYVVHTFEIPVPIRLDSDAIVPRLEWVLRDYCARYVLDIAQYFEEVKTQKMFVTPTAEPTITRMPRDTSMYCLVVRFASPLNKRLAIQQAILDEFIRIQYLLMSNDENSKI